MHIQEKKDLTHTPGNLGIVVEETRVYVSSDLFHLSRQMNTLDINSFYSLLDAFPSAFQQFQPNPEELKNAVQRALKVLKPALSPAMLAQLGKPTPKVCFGALIPDSDQG